MPRMRKKARSSEDSDDDDYAPPASARRPTIKVKPREQRARHAPAAFSPTADTPPRKSRKAKDSSPETTDSNSAPTAAAPPRPEYKRLENKVKSQAHRLRYPLAFVDAYEAEGWRKSSKDKLKPSKELEAEHRKIVKGQHALINGLRELTALYEKEPQVPLLAKFEDVHCSRCGSTDIEPDNDILLCDSVGCHRAYHQKCQTPIVLTANIPVGDEPWFCEVCLAIFECLKSINSVFGATYEKVDDLFPELKSTEQQATTDASSTAQSGEESGTGTALADEEDEDEEDEDFVCNEEEDDDDDEDEDEEDNVSDKDSEEAGEGDEEMAVEVPESAQDLRFLSTDDVIDPKNRTTRSQSSILPPKPVSQKTNLVGEPAAKIDRKTGEVILGVVAAYEPPAKGRYSRWRIDYRDGTSEELTRSKTQAAINRAAVEDSDLEQDGDGAEADAKLIVRGKRKRNNVDYRQLNELMFAGKDEDSEEDETFEVKEGSEDEPDDEDDNEEADEADEGGKAEEAGEEEAARDALDKSSPTAVTEAHEEISQPSDEKLNGHEHVPIHYLSMEEGMLS